MLLFIYGTLTNICRADATIASQATGAMSWAFISAMKANPQQSYVELLNSIREVLATKYTQKPQLSCSHPLGTFISGNWALLTRQTPICFSLCRTRLSECIFWKGGCLLLLLRSLDECEIFSVLFQLLVFSPQLVCHNLPSYNRKLTTIHAHTRTERFPSLVGVQQGSTPSGCSLLCQFVLISFELLGVFLSPPS